MTPGDDTGSVTKPRIQTMTELSKQIHVSRPTLARYFQDPESVLPSTAKKIRDRLADVDYVYNFLATRQNRKTTGLIGVIIPHYRDLFYASLLDSIEQAAVEAGLTVFTHSSKGSAETEAAVVEKLRTMNVDGAIIAPLGEEASTQALSLASRDFPIVFVDSQPVSPIPGTDFVGTDNKSSIGSMVDFLCRTGEAPVFLGMPRLNGNAIARENAYRDAMQNSGAEAHLVETGGVFGSWRFEEYGYEVMDTHFSHGRYDDATILCANDRVAIGAIRAANKYGLFGKRTGERSALRIAGHDDHPLSQYIFPSLTTVAQDIDGIAKGAVDLLIERARMGRNGEAVCLLKDTTLILRESG